MKRKEWARFMIESSLFSLLLSLMDSNISVFLLLIYRFLDQLLLNAYLIYSDSGANLYEHDMLWQPRASSRSHSVSVTLSLCL